MKDEFTYRRTPSRLRQGVRLHTARRHRFRVRPHRLAQLELADVLFDTNSAVMMPYAFDEGDEGLHGLDVLYVAFRYAADHPDVRLLIAGHTDTAGGDRHNMELSTARADGVYCLLMDDRATWADLMDRWHRTSDVQRLLKDYRNIDPGPVDDKMGPKTRAAIEAFQQVYNRDRQALGIPDAPDIAVDGMMGPKTWGAFFDYYQYSLAQLLGCGPQWTLKALLGIADTPTASAAPEASAGSPVRWRARMEAWRDHITMGSPERPTLGCGESFPIDEAQRDNYCSDTNRRVELLFFSGEDVPVIPEAPRQGATYTLDECPFYDTSAYQRDRVDGETVFKHTLELQTVNEQGLPVPNVDLMLKPLRGGEITLSSDDTGYARTEEVPPGLTAVLLASGEPAAMRLGENYANALLAATPAHQPVAAIATVIVEANLSSEARTQRKNIHQIYNRSAPRERAAPPRDEETPEEDPSASATAPVRDKKAVYAHDNLALIAGPAGDRFNRRALRDALEEWIQDYYPQVAQRGFILFVQDDNELMCIDPEGTVRAVLPLREGVSEKLCGAFGAYAAFATPGDPLFRDMQRFAGIVGAEGITDDGTPELGDLIVDDGDAQARLAAFFDDHPDRFHVLYRAPTGGQLWRLAEHGGAGYLEDYGDAEGALRERIHERNLAIVTFVARAYRAQLQRYVDNVDAIGPQDLDQLNKIIGAPNVTKAQKAEAARKARTAVRQAYADLKALGPPPRIYFFPKPVGATDDEWMELFRANNMSDFRGYRAVADKVDEIEDRHSEGAVYFRVKVKLNGEYKRGEPDEAFVGDGHYMKGNLKVEHTIDFGTDGLLAKRDVALAGEAKIGPNQEKTLTLAERKRRGKEMAGAAVEGEYNIETGERKATVKGAIRGAGFEVATDGTIKLKAPNGAEASYNVATNEFGQGVEVDLASIIPEWVKEKTPDAVGDTLGRYVPSQLYIGLHMQGVLEESIMAYLTMAPGFFERRQPYEYFDPALRWNDLSGFEQDNLKVLGWTRKTWDERGLTPYEDFPEACYSDPGQAGSGMITFVNLSGEERMAAVQLGLDRRDWGKWKDVAKQP